MKKRFGLFMMFALVCMLLGGASMAQADDPTIIGDWTGTWTCPGGKKTEGALEGHIGQDKYGALTGEFTMKGTVIGDKTGKFNGGASEGKMKGDIVGEIYVEMTGTYTKDSITGTYHSEYGDGSFALKRR